MPNSRTPRLRSKSDHRNAAVLLAVLGLFTSSCAGDAASSDTNPNAGAFKNATVDNQEAGSGATTLLILPFTAPSDGFVSISATGNCAVFEALPVGSVLNVEIETLATDQSPRPGDGSFLIGGGNTAPLQGSFAVMRFAPVSAGQNAAYLVLENPSTGGRLACSASMTATFQSHQLP